MQFPINYRRSEQSSIVIITVVSDYCPDGDWTINEVARRKVRSFTGKGSVYYHASFIPMSNHYFPIIKPLFMAICKRNFY